MILRALFAVIAIGAGLVGPAAAQSRPSGGPEQNKALLDLLNQVEGAGRQLRELRGQVEDVSNRVEQGNDRAQKAEKRHGDLYNDTDGRVRRLEQLAKDDAAERKKFVQQIADMELRLKKLEADLEVQFRKFEADHEARFRRIEAAATASAADIDTRTKRLEQTVGTTRNDADLEARLKRLEAADLESRLRRLEGAGASPAAVVTPSAPAPPGPVEPSPGAATTPIAPGGKPATGAAATPVPAVPASGAAAASLDPLTVGRSYDQALAKQRAGDSAGAVQGFQTFLKLYPRHELAPNAQYWLGEAYYRMGDYANAISSQQRLLASYPDHLKVPDAMLILSNAQSAAGDLPGARKTLEDIVAKHPLSESAEKARQRLGKLR
jgi:tol-pal system protein YbgF